jgi:hypothetical protein
MERIYQRLGLEYSDELRPDWQKQTSIFMKQGEDYHQNRPNALDKATKEQLLKAESFLTGGQVLMDKTIILGLENQRPFNFLKASHVNRFNSPYRVLSGSQTQPFKSLKLNIRSINANRFESYIFSTEAEAYNGYLMLLVLKPALGRLENSLYATREEALESEDSATRNYDAIQQVPSRLINKLENTYIDWIRSKAMRSIAHSLPNGDIHEEDPFYHLRTSFPMNHRQFMEYSRKFHSLWMADDADYPERPPKPAS